MTPLPTPFTTSAGGLLPRWQPHHAALTIGVLGLLAWTLLAMGDAGHALRTAGAIWTRPDLLGLFAASYSAAFALRAVAWRLLLAGGPGVLRLFGFLQVALLANHLFPTKVGEVVRVGLLARTGTPLARAASSTLLARLLDLGSLCVLAVAWAPLAGGSAGTLLTALALPLVLLILAALGLHALATGRLTGLWERLPGRVAALGERLEDALRAIPPGRVPLALAVALPSWALEALALWAVAEAAGPPLSLPLAVTATAFTIAFQGFQLTPGGIGLYEASLTGVLTLFGVEPGAAVTLAVATHALKFAYAYGVGLLCLAGEAGHDMSAASRARTALGNLRRDPAAPATPRAVWLGVLGLALGFALLYQLGVPLRATYGARVNVDEPFYLLTTVSLLADGDLDLANDYALRRYRQFFDHADELWYQSDPTSDGRVLSPHNVGLSVLILPAYALGGLEGVKAFLGMVGGVTVGLTGLLAYRATGHRAAALLAAAILGISAPLFVYATQIYPEMPAALLVTLGAWLLLGARPGLRTAAALALCLSGLVWLGTKYGPVGGALCALALLRLRPRARLLLLGLLVPSAIAYAWFHLATYGGLTPYGVNRLYAGANSAELVQMHLEVWDRLYRLLALWIDGEFGLVRWAPALLLALPALALVLHRPGAVGWSWMLVFGTQLLVAVFLSLTMRGWWFPGRMLVAVLPLLGVPLSLALAALARRPLAAGAALGLVAYTAGTTAALVVSAHAGQVALAIDPFAMPWGFFQALAPLFPVYTAYTARTWLLTASWALTLALLAAAPVLAGRLRAGRPGRPGRPGRRARVVGASRSSPAYQAS